MLKLFVSSIKLVLLSFLILGTPDISTKLNEMGCVVNYDVMVPPGSNSAPNSFNLRPQI